MALQEQDLDGLEGIIANNDRVCCRVELKESVFFFIGKGVLGRGLEYNCSVVANQVAAGGDEDVEGDVTMYRLEW